MHENCIFCKIAKKEIPKEIIYENDNFLSFFDISPQIEGHTLVISKKHFETILDIPNSIAPELFDCVKNTLAKLKNKYEFTGFNLVNNNFKSAEQVVPHLHFHILPRKDGDGKTLGLTDK